jgi:hypothetical protein
MHWVIHTGNFIHDFAAECEINACFWPSVYVDLVLGHYFRFLLTHNDLNIQTLRSNKPLSNESNARKRSSAMDLNHKSAFLERTRQLHHENGN